MHDSIKQQQQQHAWSTASQTKAGPKLGSDTSNDRKDHR